MLVTRVHYMVNGGEVDEPAPDTWELGVSYDHVGSQLVSYVKESRDEDVLFTTK